MYSSYNLLNIVVLISIATANLPLAFAKNNKLQPRATLIECRKAELLKKDCHLKHEKIHIQVWNDKIFLKTQVGRDLKPLSIESTVGEWSFVRLEKVAGRLWLSLGLWGPPAGEGSVESLNWSVYEVANNQVTKKIEKLLQKRKKIEEGPFKYDQPSSYKLFVKNNKVHWKVGRDEGSID